MNEADPRPAAKAPSRAVWLAAARALWLALATLVMAIAFAAIPLGLHLMQTACMGSDCSGGRLSLDDARALAMLGLPVRYYAWSETVWAALIVLAMLAVATIVFWHRQGSAVAVLTSFFLLTFYPLFYDGLMRALVRAEPVWYSPVAVIEALGACLTLVLFFFFPNGKFMPVQMRLMLIPIAAYTLILLLITPWFTMSSGITPLDRLLSSVYRVFLLIGLAAQVYRYRRFSTPVERQQTKWALFGMALFALQDIAFPVWPIIFPALGQPGLGRSLYTILGETLAKTFLLLFIFSVAVAIMHYRLWEIDLLINRTLVYVPLTATLAGLFAASIALSQEAFVAVTGQSSEAASAITTLVVVAAFTPIKDRLQTTVDKRFKYQDDPARRLNAFEDQLRTRLYLIDPTQVTRRLVEEAMGAFSAKGGAVFSDVGKQPSYTCGQWDGEIQLSAAIATREHKYGQAALGVRRDGRAYTDSDRASLEQAAAFVARVIEQDSRSAISDSSHGGQQPIS